jgi:hypothetical protein
MNILNRIINDKFSMLVINYYRLNKLEYFCGFSVSNHLLQKQQKQNRLVH